MSDQFDREKTCYEQNYAQFRSLNNIMWQVPIIAMTLTGGAWYAVAKLGSEPMVQIMLLGLAGAGNLGLILIIKRIRFVISEYLKSLKDFYPGGYVNAIGTGFFEKSERVVNVFSCLMLAASICSFSAIYSIDTYKSEKDAKAAAEITNISIHNG